MANISMNIFDLKRSWGITVCAILLACFITTLCMPIVTSAQEFTGALPTELVNAPTPPPTSAQSTECSWWNWIVNWSCIPKAAAVYSSMAIIYVTGWALGTAGVLMNTSIEFTTIGFESQIYSRIQGGVEAVWTVFRDLANILIIGTFTFIAISMILNLESFGSRKMVAKVLIVAILINFSLLFTRVIIGSSNFVATQFYKAAQFGAAPAGTANANGTLTDYSTGISGKFAQLMGVATAQETKDNLWKVAGDSKDLGFAAIVLGILTAVVFIATALLFFYIAFLLIARAILFIMLLVTSSLAFASYLIPGGGYGGYGWNSWWSSLLKNAAFGPLLLILLWATMQLGIGIKTIAGSGTLGGLLADPASGGNINALFSYLLLLGMLYASIKISTSFANKIGGFDWAAMGPAMGAGLLGRLGGFLGRQTLGRGSLKANEYLMGKAQSAEAGSRSQRLYNFGAQKFGGMAKSDMNVLSGRLGKAIQGTAGLKSLDSITGKTIGGFKGAQDTFKKQVAEGAKQLAYTDEQKKAETKKALEKQMKENPALKADHDAAEKAHEDAKKTLDEAMKNAATAQSNVESRYKPRIKKLEDDLDIKEAAAASDSTKIPAAQAAQRALRDEAKRMKSEMNIQNERINRAKKALDRTVQQFQDVSEKIGEAAIASGKLPEKFASAGEIAEKTVKNTYTSLLRATVPTPAGVDKLAEKTGKEAGKPKENKRETLDLIRRAAKDKLIEEKPKTP